MYTKEHSTEKRTEYVEIKEYRGCNIFITLDSDAYNPRTEFDNYNFGRMVCFHRKYNLGDKHDFTVESFKEFLRRPDVISLPLYLYDHSGITMSTDPFSCPWDSGQVGAIYITKEEALKEKIDPDDTDKILQILKYEVEEYDNYITGNVYCYYIKEANDSCCGYFGCDHEESGLMNAARHSIDHLYEENNTIR